MILLVKRICTILLAFCAFFALPSAANEEKVLNVYNWTDYIAPDTIAKFEKETGIKVHYSTYEGNGDLNAKLLTKKSGYDIVVPSGDWAKKQIAAGLLQKLDKSQLPNWRNLDPDLLTKMQTFDASNSYLAGWLWSYTTVGVNVDKVIKVLGKTPIPDNLWELVLNPKYTAKLQSCGISYLDSASDIIPPALMYLGKKPYSDNADDYKAAAQLLTSVRPHVKSIRSDISRINDLVDGKTCVAIGWAGDFNQAYTLAKTKKTKINITAVMPKTGAFMFIDSMAIPVDAKHVGNAHKFINYILRPDVHAAITNATNYANPNKASIKYVKTELRADQSIFLNANDLERLHSADSLDDKTSQLREEIFAKFKAGN